MMMKPDAAASIWLSQLPMLIACVALAGCADQPIGQGPIKFTPKMQAQYDQYRQSTTPGAFVVTKQGSTFYSYCDSLDCRTGATSIAMRLCRQRDVGECFVYDVGGHVIWREDLPPSMSAEAVEAAVATERGRNALKVDCSDQLKSTMPATLRAELVTALGVKDSRVPWTFCDRLVEGVASHRITTQEFLDAQQGRADEPTLSRLIDQVRAGDKGLSPLPT